MVIEKLVYDGLNYVYSIVFFNSIRIKNKILIRILFLCNIFFFVRLI